MALKPLRNRVIVRRTKEEERSAGGIFIPDSAKEKPASGTVIAVGPGMLTDAGNIVEPIVSEGDSVLFGKYAGTELTVDGEDFLILTESDILAIVE